MNPRPVVDPNDKNQKPTRERIFEAAVDLFARDGYSGVSIRDITRAVDIKESSFYNHFPSKEALLQAILDYFRVRYRQLTASEVDLDEILPQRTPEEFWMRGALLSFDIMQDPMMKKINCILTLEQYRSPQAQQIILEEIIERPLKFASLVFEKMIKLGKIRPYDPELLASEYLMPTYTLTLQFMLLDAAGLDTSAVRERLMAHIHFFGETIRPDQD